MRFLVSPVFLLVFSMRNHKCTAWLSSHSVQYSVILWQNTIQYNITSLLLMPLLLLQLQQPLPTTTTNTTTTTTTIITNLEQ